MIAFLGANIGTILVGMAMILLITGILFSMYKRKKKKISSCGCGCAQCSASEICHKK